MHTTQQPEAPAPEARLAPRAEGGHTRMAHFQMMQQMSLEELLYCVLVGDGRRLCAEPR
jgi:hypothetical protein